MSFGKMNTFIELLAADQQQDDEGFVNTGDTVLASLRAYREDRHGNETWANRAAFSQVTSLFRFRRVPGLDVSTAHSIICADGRYRIHSVEDVKGRGMYIEVLAEKMEPTVR